MPDHDDVTPPRPRDGAGRFAPSVRRPEAATEQTGRFSVADVEDLRLRVEASEQREREREIEDRVRAETAGRSSAWPVATVLVVLILALAAAGCVVLSLLVAHGVL